MATRLKVRLPPELRPPEIAEVNETNRWRVQEKDRNLRRALVTYFRNVARLAVSSGTLPYMPDPEELYAVMLFPTCVSYPARRSSPGPLRSRSTPISSTDHITAVDMGRRKQQKCSPRG